MHSFSQALDYESKLGYFGSDYVLMCDSIPNRLFCIATLFVAEMTEST